MFSPDEYMPKLPVIYKHYQNLGLQIYPKLDNLDGRAITLKAKKQIDFNKIINEYYLPEEDAREALYKFVDGHCCYGKSPVKKLQFNKIETNNYYRYVLHTFTESRSTSYASEPYFYEDFNKKHGVEPDRPWNIKVRPKSLFKEETIRIEIPNTSHIECCTNCSGIGTNLCHTCHGRTYKHCSYCNGTGYSLLSSHNDAQDSFANRKYYTENYSDMYAHNPLYNTNSQNQNNHNFHHNYHDSHSFYASNNNYFQNNTCAYCNGNGSEICRACDNGRIGCRMCDKSGYLRWYIELQVKYENNLDDYLKKNSHKPISDMLIRNCIGEKIFTEKKSQLMPIETFPENEINKASRDLILLHLSKYSHCRILAQRHEIFTIPITVCTYQWRKKLYRFSVYGLDQQVHSPDYPSKCSCCTIL